MSFDLSTALAQFAVESGEVTAEEVRLPAGEEEITVITDETQSTLEEAVSDLADDVERLEKKDDAAEKVVDAIESLESYVAQAQDMIAKGEHLNGRAASLWVQGVTSCMEARGIPAAIFETSVTAMAESFESAAQEDYSTEAEEKGEGLLRRLYNMLKSAVMAVATAIKEFFTTFGKSATAIQAAGAKLKRVAGGLKGTAKEGDLKGSSFATLAVGGSINASKALDDAKSGYVNGALKASKAIRAAFTPLVNAFNTPTAASLKSTLSSLNTGALSGFTEELPGGYQAVLKMGEGEGAAKLSGAAFTVKKPDSKASVEKAPVLSPSDIGNLATKIIDLGKLMSQMATEGDATLAANDKLIKAAEKAIGKEKAEKEDAAAARELFKLAKGLISMNKGIVPTYGKYLGMVGKDAYRYGMACAGKYSSKEPKADKDAGAAGAEKKDETAA